MAESNAATETDLRFELVRQRYGKRLSPEELAEVRKGVEAVVSEAGALRAARLRNADGPYLPTPSDA